MAESTGPDAARADFDLALLSDPGTDRPDNEDACGHFIDGPQTVLFVVADGIGGYEGGAAARRRAVDRRWMPLGQNDRLLRCSDGLYNVLEEHELEHLLRLDEAAGACKALIETANARGTADNLTAAVFMMNGATPFAETGGGARWREGLRRLFSRRR